MPLINRGLWDFLSGIYLVLVPIAIGIGSWSLRNEPQLSWGSMGKLIMISYSPPSCFKDSFHISL